MMSFKEFCQRSSKGAKAPPRKPESFKTHKTPNKILDRIAERKVVKGRSGQ
jgi:hypothetical protein